MSQSMFGRSGFGFWFSLVLVVHALLIAGLVWALIKQPVAAVQIAAQAGAAGGSIDMAQIKWLDQLPEKMVRDAIENPSPLKTTIKLEPKSDIPLAAPEPEPADVPAVEPETRSRSISSGEAYA